MLEKSEGVNTSDDKKQGTAGRPDAASVQGRLMANYRAFKAAARKQARLTRDRRHTAAGAVQGMTGADWRKLENEARQRGKTVFALLLDSWRASQHTGRSWTRCNSEGCKKKAAIKGLCRRCYARIKKREERGKEAKAAHATFRRNALKPAPDAE